MKDYSRKIQIVTRPKEALGFYEYFMDTRKRRYILLPSDEPQLFQTAIENIRTGKNPGGWVLTKPSEKDKGIYVMPFSQNAFYVTEGDTFFFPNQDILNEWLEWHWTKCTIENSNENIFGIPIKYIKGTLYS